MSSQYSEDASPRASGDNALIVRHIHISDLLEALRLGWEDFKAIPSHAIMLCLIYPVLGLGLARVVLGYSVLPLLFPLAAGFRIAWSLCCHRTLRIEPPP